MEVGGRLLHVGTLGQQRDLDGPELNRTFGQAGAGQGEPLASGEPPLGERDVVFRPQV